MPHDAINSWIEKAKTSNGSDGGSSSSGTQSRGNLIMEIAERLRPSLTRLFEGVKNNEGVLIQPTHIRGYALNMAQKIVSEQN